MTDNIEDKEPPKKASPRKNAGVIDPIAEIKKLLAEVTSDDYVVEILKDVLDSNDFKSSKDSFKEELSEELATDLTRMIKDNASDRLEVEFQKVDYENRVQVSEEIDDLYGRIQRSIYHTSQQSLESIISLYNDIEGDEERLLSQIKVKDKDKREWLRKKVSQNYEKSLSIINTNYDTGDLKNRKYYKAHRVIIEGLKDRLFRRIKGVEDVLGKLDDADEKGPTKMGD